MLETTSSLRGMYEVLAELYHGPSWNDGNDLGFALNRKLVCTPFDGANGRAGWVVCVNGSPPKGTLLLFDHGEAVGPAVWREVHKGLLAYFLKLNAVRPVAKRAHVERIARFYREHLAGCSRTRPQAPVVFKNAADATAPAA